MANIIPPFEGAPFGADPSQIQVLLSGNIADDDLLWVVRCSVGELHKLLQSPALWVASLGALPDWSAKVPGPVLTRDFAMLVESTATLDPDGWVTVQGISGTNALSVVASKASALRSLLSLPTVAERSVASLGGSLQETLARSDADLASVGTDPFQPFWDEVSRDLDNPPTLKKPFPVNVVRSNSRFYAHFDIIDRTESPIDAAKRLATFLLGTVFDPVGFVAMLNGLDQRIAYIGFSELRSARLPIVIAPALAPKGIYANVAPAQTAPRAAASDASPVDPTDFGCILIDGPYAPGPDGGGTGTTDGTLVKRYEVDPTPSGS